MKIEGFFDEATSSVSYLVIDEATGACAVIDSVLDFDAKAGRTSIDGVQRLIDRVKQLELTVEWILETHVHADHLSAAPLVQDKLGGRLAIGRRITEVQKVFGTLFNAGSAFARDGRQFDHLFDDGDEFSIGTLRGRAMHTPGHTPACMAYVIGPAQDERGDRSDAAFVGDTLFMPDHGTARCDFPGGDARTLYRSIQKLLGLPAATRLYVCHDYQPGGREVRTMSTVADQRAGNIHVRDGIGEDEFVSLRTRRDATLAMPTLILPAVQVNMRAGRMPPAENDGVTYLKIPINAL